MLGRFDAVKSCQVYLMEFREVYLMGSQALQRDLWEGLSKAWVPIKALIRKEALSLHAVQPGLPIWRHCMMCTETSFSILQPWWRRKGSR